MEDNLRLAKTLKDLMMRNKLLADIAEDGISGLDSALSGIYDLLVLDVTLPGMDGFAVAGALRAKGLATPILMLTARVAVADRVEGLNAGADYYLTKPFSNDELMACVRTLLRRGWSEEAGALRFADLELEQTSGRLSCGERSTRLSQREQQVIEKLMLAGAPGVSRDSFLRDVWEPDLVPEGNVLDVYITFLRKKLTYLRAHVRIASVRGFGYRLEEDRGTPV